MLTITPGAAVALFGVLLTLAGVVYQFGRLAARVESLEEWRRDMTRELGAIHEAVRHVSELIRGEEV